MTKNPMAVMLSAAKHLEFSVTYEDEILRLLPQDDIPTQSLTEGIIRKSPKNLPIRHCSTIKDSGSSKPQTHELDFLLLSTKI